MERWHTNTGTRTHFEIYGKTISSISLKANPEEFKFSVTHYPNDRLVLNRFCNCEEGDDGLSGPS